MKTRIFALCGIFLAVCGVITAKASTTVSVQFPQYYANGIVNPMNGDNYTAGVVSVQNWNVADTNTGTSPASNSSLVNSSGAPLGSTTLVNSTGANTSLAFTYSGYTVNDNTNNGSFPSPIWYEEGGLTDAYIAGGASFNETGAPETLTVSGLTAGHAYNLIVYVTAPWWDNGGSNPASVSAGGTTYYIETSNALGAWTPATSTTSGAPTTGNYVQFSNLTGATSQTVTVTGAYVGLAGFQVVDLGASGGGAPSAPTGLTATAGNAQAALSWTASTGATSYNVYRGTSAGGESSTAIATGITTTSYTNTGLSNGTTYYYTVAAVNSSGTSGYSNEASATPNVTTYALTVNSGSGSGNYAAGATVTVTANAPQSGYQFAGWTGATSALANPSAATTTLTMPAAATSITATYSSTGGGGTTTYYQDSFTRTGDMTGSKPDVVDTDAATWGNVAGTGQYPISGGTVSINPAAYSWSAEYLPVNGTSGITLDGTKNFTLSVLVTSGSTGLTGISLNTAAPGNLFDHDFAALATSSGFAGAYAFNAGNINYNFGAGISGATTISIAYNASAGTLTYTVGSTTVATQTGVTAAQVAAIQYIALGDDGYGGGAATPAPTFDNFTFTVGSGGSGTAPAAPTGLAATAGNGQVALSWTASTGATSYNVYRGTSAGGESSTAIATGITTTSYTNTGLSNGTTYYYTVAAVNGSGTSGYSNEASATPNVTTYALTVNSGSGSGTYAAGATVTVTANAPQSGYQFAGWTGATSVLANPASATTTLTMPAAATSITATYSSTGGGGTTTYYQDSFSRTGDMTGSTPDVVDTGAAAWGNVAGTGQYPISNGTASINPAAYSWSAEYLPVNGTSGITLDGTKNFTLSVVVTSGPTGRSGICLSTAAPGNLFDHDFAALSTCSGFAGAYAFNAGNINYNYAAGITGPTTISLAYNASAATLTYTVGSTTVATQTGVTTAEVAAIRYVALGDDGYGGGAATPAPTFDNFTFTVGSGGGGTAPAAPTNLAATAGNALVNLSWTASTGATSYNVYRGTSAGGESSTAIATGITTTSYTNTGLSNGTTYYYTVAAVNSSGTSGYSNEASATPNVTSYALTVNSGSGTGNYAAGATVTVTANAPQSGYQFAGWTGATSALANPSAATTTLTMPAAATSITATYSAIPTYALTVNSGTGGGTYAAGTVVTVTANAPQSGYQFAGWTGATSALANPSASTTTLTMPAAATSITATYSQTGATTYALSVTNGSGGGNYVAGTVVTITANAAPSGYQFAGWTEAYGGTGVLGNASASTTTFTTSAAVATVTATYTPVGGTTYSLTVSGGTGSGSYPAGTIVTITANAPPNGSQFVRWLGASSPLVLGDADSSTTTITMPPVATTVTSSYGTIAPTYAVTVTNGTGGGTYPAGAVVQVSANAPASGYNFTGWTGTTGALANPSFSTTTLTVPASAASITANYAATTSTYALTVTNGAGGGTYAPGTAVTVTAGAPASGYQFAGWTGSTSDLANAAAPITTFTMPSGTAGITATYTPISSTGTLVLAVGLERIVSGYNGPAIRIQRPSDNTQEDIGFASGSNQLNVAAVSAFLGQSQGWITTLYAQDGSGHNVTTPLPTSTATMPTISAVDPTSITINGSQNLTTRNIEQPYAYLQGNQRYFVLPPSVSVNKSQMSAFLAYQPDYSGSGGGIPYMTLYEVGNLPLPNTVGAPATADAVDLISCSSGLQGLTEIATTTSNGTATSTATESFANDNVVPHSQPTVVGLTTSPGSAPTLYLDGIIHGSGGTAPPSVTCAGGYLLGGNGSASFYGIPLYSQYNFLGFALYSGTVPSTTAATISSAMLPHTMPSFNIVADGDSITQGTGAVDGYNMLHYVAPLLNHPADITNLAIYGTTSPSAVGHLTYPTTATSAVAMLYNSSYTKNIYYVAIGTNDIHGGFNTGAGTWSTVMQALQDAKAMGFKTVVATVLHEYGETAAESAQVDDFNALARAAVGQPYLDAIVDYEADPRLGNTGIYYPAFSGDGTHPSDAGYQIMSTIAAPVFNSLIGP